MMRVDFKIGNFSLNAVVFLKQKLEFSLDDVASVIKEVNDIEVKGGNVFLKVLDEDQSLPNIKQINASSFETRQELTLLKIEERASEINKSYLIKSCASLKYARSYERVSFNEQITVFCKNGDKMQCKGFDISQGGISFLVNPILLTTGYEFISVEYPPIGKKDIELKTIKYLDKDTIQLGAKFIAINKDKYAV